MALDPVLNFAECVVSTGYDAAATSIVLEAGDGAKLPAPSTDGAFNLVWFNATDYPNPANDPNVEIVRCTARSTDTLTVTRAQEGTDASTKNTGGKVYKMILGITKKMIDDLRVSVTSVASSATPTPTGGSKENEYYLTALAAAAEFAAPSGTPANGNTLIIRIKDNATARALTYNVIYRAVGVTLPTTTVISKTIYIGAIYNSADSKWDCVSVVEEA